MADIFDEINEDLKRDQMQELWSRYGKYVIIAVSLADALSSAFKAIQRGRIVRQPKPPRFIIRR